MKCVAIAATLALAIAVPVALEGHSPAQAAPPNAAEYDGPGTLLSADEALTQDAELLQKEIPDYTLEQAKQAVRDTADFGRVQTNLRDKFPAEFAQASVTYGPNGLQGTVLVKGKASSAFKSAIEQLPMEVTLAEDALWAKAESQLFTKPIIDALVRQPGIGDVRVRPDIASGAVQVTVGLAGPNDLALATSTIAAFEKTVPGLLVGVGSRLPTVTFDIDTSFKGTPTVLSGGTALSQVRNPGPDGHVCTSAFTAVRRSDGVGGLLTADHCFSSLWYEGRVELWKPGAFNSSVTTDARFTIPSNGEGIRPYFIRDRSSQGELYTSRVCEAYELGQGSFVYTYGSTTKARQTSKIRIHDVDVYYKRIDKTYYKLTETTSDVVQGGDSGGPWFIREIATGITSGHTDQFFYDSSYYAPVDDAQRRTNTRINLAGCY